MLRRGMAVVAMASAPLVAACSLLLGEGFTDPDSPSASSDASAGDTTSALDAPMSSDARDSTLDTIEATPPDGGCPDATVAFCDDFERNDVQGNWDAVVSNDGGAIALETSSSGGRRLRTAVGPVGSGAYLTKSIGLVPQRVHFEMTLELEALPGSGANYIAGIGMLNANNPPSVVYLYAEPAGAFFVQQVTNGVAYHRDPIAIPPGSPHRVVVDVTFGGNARVIVDGVTALDQPTKTFLVRGAPALDLGAHSIDETGASFAFRVDDFVFTAE